MTVFGTLMAVQDPVRVEAPSTQQIAVAAVAAAGCILPFLSAPASCMVYSVYSPEAQQPANLHPKSTKSCRPLRLEQMLGSHGGTGAAASFSPSKP